MPVERPPHPRPGSVATVGGAVAVARAADPPPTARTPPSARRSARYIALGRRDGTRRLPLRGAPPDRPVRTRPRASDREWVVQGSCASGDFDGPQPRVIGLEQGSRQLIL